MTRNTYLILVIAASLMFISQSAAYSAEQAATQEAPAVTSAPQEAPAVTSAPQEASAVTNVPAEAETQWVWGEVISSDPENKAIVVKYLDYETDQEKEITITTDDKTTYENIKSLDEIKPQDAVSVDYTVSLDGKNIAKNISLEKPEAAPKPPQENTATNPSVEAAPNTETVPQDIQPATPKEQ